MTSCTLSGQGCTGALAKTTIGAESPWPIEGDQTEPDGWKEIGCVTCTNAGGDV